MGWLNWQTVLDLVLCWGWGRLDGGPVPTIDKPGSVDRSVGPRMSSGVGLDGMTVGNYHSTEDVNTTQHNATQGRISIQAGCRSNWKTSDDIRPT